MSIQIENLNSEGVLTNLVGSKTLEPGDVLYLLMKAHKASVSVTVDGTSNYMVSVTQASTEKIRNEEATFVDADTIDFVETDDFVVHIGGGIKIENKSDSVDDIVVDWRI